MDNIAESKLFLGAKERVVVAVSEMQRHIQRVVIKAFLLARNRLLSACHFQNSHGLNLSLIFRHFSRWTGDPHFVSCFLSPRL